MGIVSVLSDSVSKLRAVGSYHDIDLKGHQQEFSVPFEPLPPVEPATCMPLEMNEVFIVPNVEKLAQTYDTLHNVPTGQTNEYVKLSLENALHTDIPPLEYFNVPARINIRKSNTTTKEWHTLQKHNCIIDCSKHEKYFIDTTYILP